VARPGRQSAQAPGPRGHPRTAPQAGDRRRPPRRPAHRHRAAGVRRPRVTCRRPQPAHAVATSGPGVGRRRISCVRSPCRSSRVSSRWMAS